MKKLGLFISILIITLLFGCGEEKPEFSEHITPVLEVMANAPNADYLDPESMLSYGLNSEPSEAEREEAARLTQINDENWEKALGEHFGPGCLRASINTGIGKNLLWTVEATDVESIELKSIDLKETKQNGDEIVSVTVTVDGEKEVVFEMKFSYDKDGLIDGVWYEPEGMNVVEVILNAQ